MSSLFAIIDWDDGKTSDIPVSAIKTDESKEGSTESEVSFSIGDYVKAKLYGFAGYHYGTIAALDSELF